MALSVSIVSDSDSYVCVRLDNSGGGAVSSTKIVDASALTHSIGNDTELLSLESITCLSDMTATIAGLLNWADSSGSAAGTSVFVLGSGSHTTRFRVENTVSGSNGDVYFQSGNAKYVADLMFKKVRGYKSNIVKWNMA